MDSKGRFGDLFVLMGWDRSTAQVTERLDGLISEIRDLQRPWFDGKTNAKNIVLVLLQQVSEL